MKNAAACLLLMIALGFGQSAPAPLQVTRMSGITGSSTVFDNRADNYRHHNIHLFCATGTGSWSVVIQYADGSSFGPWTSFTDPAATVSNGSSTCAGSALGYHDFIRFSITGNATVSYSAVTNFWVANGTGSGGGGGGSPGSPNNSIQYNSSGSFAGIPYSGLARCFITQAGSVGGLSAPACGAILATDLPIGTASAFGGIKAPTCSAGQHYSGISAGVLQCTADTVGAVDHALLTHLDYASAGHTGFQSTITTGTTAQYFRGDLSLATFPTVPAVATSGIVVSTGSAFRAGLLADITGLTGTGATAVTNFGLSGQFQAPGSYLTANQTITISGDGSGSGATSITLTTTGINGTTVPTNNAADQVLATIASASGSWRSVPNCADSAGQHLNYSTSTHSFTCGTSSGAGTAAFSAITSGSNTTATMTCGTGCTITAAGSGVISATQINGSAPAAVATSGSASDLSSGTLPAARLPNPAASTLGGTKSIDCTGSGHILKIGTDGTPTCGKDSASDPLSPQPVYAQALTATTAQVGDGTTAGYVELYPPNDAVDAFVLKAPSSRATKLTLLVPSGDPTSGQVISCGTPSAGVSTCSWAANGGGSMVYPSGTGVAQVSGGTAWGTTLGVSTVVSVSSTDSELPTAKSVYTAISSISPSGTHGDLDFPAGSTNTGNAYIQSVWKHGTNGLPPAIYGGVSYFGILTSTTSDYWRVDFRLPQTWTGTGVTAKMAVFDKDGNARTVSYTAQIGCTASGDNVYNTQEPTYGSAATLSGSQAANSLLELSASLSSIPAGCTAGKMARLKIIRGSFSDDHGIFDATLTW